MSHASQQDRAKSPRRYKEEPAPVAAQLVSASLFTQLHDRCLPTQTRCPLAFRSLLHASALFCTSLLRQRRIPSYPRYPSSRAFLATW